MIKNTNDVYETMKAFAASAALNTALELNLFWLLSEQPAPAATVAQQLDIPHQRCQYWLELLADIGLLERTGSLYRITKTTQTAILDAHPREVWAFYAAYRREWYRAGVDLAQHVHHPGSVWEPQGAHLWDEYLRIREDPKWAADFTRMLYELRRDLANELAQMLDMTGVQRMMDLGGGSGVISIALLRSYPHLTSTVVDLPNVCAAGQEIAAENGLSDRITYFPLDFLNEDLPTGFDLVLIIDVGIYDLSLYHRVYKSLNPGGRLVLMESWAPERGVPPTGRATAAFLRSLQDPNFQFEREIKMEVLLSMAGFKDTSTCTLSNGSILLEAYRTYE